MFEKIGGPMPAQTILFAAPPTGTQQPSRAVTAASGNTSPDTGLGWTGRDRPPAGTGLTGAPGDTFRMAAFLSSLANPDAPTGPQPTFERTYLEAVAERRRSEARAGRDDAAPAPAEPARGPRAPRPGQAPGETPQLPRPPRCPNLCRRWMRRPSRPRSDRRHPRPPMAPPAKPRHPSLQPNNPP